MLEYTGERYMPCVTGQYKYEHLHRYALSLPLVTGKTVLDIASGEGYGAALLARGARSVIGVDIDNASVTHAQAQYAAHQNLTFRQGSCAAIPLPDHSVEVVTSFETIEHHDQHEEMLAEIKRVLVPGGLLIISSPNKLVYTDLPQVTNHYHVKELYFDEFDQLLKRHFAHQKFYGQRLATGSFVYALETTAGLGVNLYGGDTQALREQAAPLEATVYFVAVCSDDATRLTTPLQSVFIEPTEDLLKLQQDEHEKEIRAMHDWRQTWEQEVQTVLALRAAETQQYYEPKLQDLNNEVHRLNLELHRITSSRAYKLIEQLWRWRRHLAFGRSRPAA